MPYTKKKPDPAGGLPPLPEDRAGDRCLPGWIRGRLELFGLLWMLYAALSLATRIVVSGAGLQAGLMAWSMLPRSFAMGVLLDAVTALYMCMPFAVYLCLAPERLFGSRFGRVLVLLGFAASAAGFAYLAAAEYFFFDQFNARFNYTAVQHLIYPNEIFRDVRVSYPGVRASLTAAWLAVVVAYFLRKRIAGAFGHTCAIAQRTLAIHAPAARRSRQPVSVPAIARVIPIRQTERTGPTMIRSNDAISARSYFLVQVLGVPAILALCALLAHFSGFDVLVERYFYDPVSNGFPWDKSVPLEVVGHRIFKFIPVVFALAALAGVAASYRSARLRRWRPVLWATTIALVVGPTVVTLLRNQSEVYCPSSLKMYGGYADYATAWWSLSPAGGRCMPSGHAGAGFAMVALYFAGWASGRPAWRRWGLCIGILCGAMFSVVRFMQGAHFPSHVLWSACFDWLISSLVFLPFAVKGRLPAARRTPEGCAGGPLAAVADRWTR